MITPNTSTPYKLIAFDIDGTILNHEHKVCHRLIKVVHKLKQMGYKFTIVSARLPISALRIATELGLSNNDHVIALNGSIITNFNHDILYSKKFDCSGVNRNSNLLSTNIAINYYNDFEWYVTRPNHVTDFELSQIAIMSKYQLGSLALANKISLLAETNELEIAKEILTKIDDNLLVAFSHPKYIEVTSKDISKYTGLLEYAKILNISLNEVIAFGDGENDIQMLQNVGLGVAMDNASDYVKRFAKDIAPHHLEAGVAKYLEKLLDEKIL